MTSPTSIILDCDPGHDDAIAIMLALASPEIELVGITTVAGNQTLDKTTPNALKVLELLGRSDVPVYAGAAVPLVRELHTAPDVHGESGLDGPDLPQPSAKPQDGSAAEYLAREIRARDGKVTLVPTGPLTNVALMLELDPEARPERVVWMGGSIGEGNTTPAAEFNAYVDPEAAQRVFEAGFDTTMIGLDVTHRALITDEHRERLRAAGKVGKVAAELLDFYARFHKHRYPDLPGAPLHDPVCIAHVIRPGLVEVKDAYIEVDLGEQGRGRTNVDWRGRAASGPNNAKVGVDIDGDAFAELVIERLASLG
ncbi:MAG TPA: nucleoside hydrolase [Gaiellaceae bacterium]|nr:nucleoside hydrolase [Gaiellaceae bacterium]